MNSGDEGKAVSRVLKGLSPTIAPRRLPYAEVPLEVGAVVSVSVDAMRLRPEPAEADLQARVHAAMMEAERLGYQQGLQNGQREAQANLSREREALGRQAQAREADRQKEVATVLGTLARTLETHAARQQRLQHDMAEHSVALAFEAVCRLLGRAEERRGLLVDLVGEAMTRRPFVSMPQLRLSRADADLLTGAVDDGPVSTLLKRVCVVVDESVGPLGALLEGDGAGLDIGLDTQLQALRDAWVAALGHSGEAVEPSAGLGGKG